MGNVNVVTVVSDGDPNTCLSCSRPTTPDARGHRTLCFDCSIDECGAAYEKSKVTTNVTTKKSAKRMAGGRVSDVNTATR